MSFKLLSGTGEIGIDRWNRFIADHPDGNIFQSPEMFDLFNSVETYSPTLLALEGNDGNIKALILAVTIRDYKGLAGKIFARTVIYGGPLIDPTEKDVNELCDQILKSLLLDIKKKSFYIEFRNICDQSKFDKSFKKRSFIIQSHLNLIVGTSSPSETLSEISKSKIRQAKRSIRSGAELVIASSEEEIHSLYLILTKIYKEKIKKPLPPESFFLSFFKASEQHKLGIILLVKYAGEVAGGMVCPITPGKSLNEWYICGLDKVYNEVYPSVMLTYGAIEYAIQNNIPFFDFMGIGTPNRPYGVRDFKIRFGGKTVNYGRYVRITHPLLNPMAKLTISILRFLKLM